MILLKKREGFERHYFYLSNSNHLSDQSKCILVLLNTTNLPYTRSICDLSSRSTNLPLSKQAMPSSPGRVGGASCNRRGIVPLAGLCLVRRLAGRAFHCTELGFLLYGSVPVHKNLVPRPRAPCRVVNATVQVGLQLQPVAEKRVLERFFFRHCCYVTFHINLATHQINQNAFSCLHRINTKLEQKISNIFFSLEYGSSLF
jgi:hypothetical protein